MENGNPNLHVKSTIPQSDGQSIEALFDHVYSKHVNPSTRIRKENANSFGFYLESSQVLESPEISGNHYRKWDRDLLNSHRGFPEDSARSRRRKRYQQQKKRIIQNDSGKRSGELKIQSTGHSTEHINKNWGFTKDTLSSAFEDALKYLRQKSQSASSGSLQSTFDFEGSSSSPTSTVLRPPTPNVIMPRNMTNPAYEFSDEEDDTTL